ncbi:MAG: hypothetical protein RMJ07_02770 [Nitrososphaerota archaeon]|nr:hypothetical protein [Candidatus Bathyarchaeota archaeon]MDW8048588.1 hypothetical protein [Nitrososphaerota archaeon]
MVEKRTITVLALAALVWALSTSGLAAYYHVEMSRFQRLSDERLLTISGISRGYKRALEQQDLLMRDYNVLLGEYYMFMEDDYSMLARKYAQLLYNLGGNYTGTINDLLGLQETYRSLLDATLKLAGRKNVTREEFESVLREFDELLANIMTKSLESLLGEVTTIRVNLCIDYGNGTKTWHNVTARLGWSLFDLTRQVARIEYEYYPSMEPGHIFMKTINGVAPSPSEWKYWFWYYWDDTTNKWISGQVGCDSWTLYDNGTYRWIYKTWGDL